MNSPLHSDLGKTRVRDAGVPTAELARKHGIHANTLRLWKAKYGGMDAAEVARLKQLEDEKHADAADYREPNP